MMDYRIWRQRHEELLREAELSRRAKALRATRKRGAGRRSTLAWEIKRQAGRLLKFSADLEEHRLLGTKEVFLCGKEEQFLGRAGHSRA
jgi:hypothetical protein